MIQSGVWVCESSGINYCDLLYVTFLAKCQVVHLWTTQHHISMLSEERRVRHSEAIYSFPPASVVWPCCNTCFCKVWLSNSNWKMLFSLSLKCKSFMNFMNADLKLKKVLWRKNVETPKFCSVLEYYKVCFYNKIIFIYLYQANLALQTYARFLVAFYCLTR